MPSDPFSDAELKAATDAVLDNIMKPLSLTGIPFFVVREVLHGFVQRECANALVAAAKIRGNK